MTEHADTKPVHMIRARTIEMEFVHGIVVGNRLRQANEDAVKKLAASMEEIGLQSPILTRTLPIADDPDENVEVHLVAGLTRLRAAEKLGWKKIECMNLDIDDVDAQLIEIDENLARAELSEVEEAQHLKRRKELWEQREKNLDNLSKFEGRGNKGFAKDVAEKTGEDQRTVNRKISRAKNIAVGVLDDIKGTDMDKGVELDALKNLKQDDQRQAVDMVKDGRAKDIRDAHNVIKGVSPKEDQSFKWRGKFELLINKATPADLNWARNRLALSEAKVAQVQKRKGASEARRMEQFEREFAFVVDTCLNSKHITVPYLSADRAREIVRKIQKAEKALRELRKRIEAEQSNGRECDA